MTTDNAHDDHPIPWKIDGEIYEGDGAAGVSINDANNQSVVIANSWSLFDRGEPRNATERDWSIARKVVEAVNGFHPWISVKDRLPPEHEDGESVPVLVWPRARGGEVYQWLGVYSHAKSCWYDVEDPEYRLGLPVTHWAPLLDGPPEDHT